MPPFDAFRQLSQEMLFTTTILAMVSCVSSFVAPARAETPVFANGADVGWLTQLESFGYTYQDQTHTKMDALQILKNHGVNSIRIRTLVNQSNHLFDRSRRRQ
jgi:arabinogalactan endo-1,4-beta-galactosidase